MSTTGTFDKILTLLRQETTIDFSLYKEATLRRRVARRMMAAKLTSLGKYYQYLKRHPAEIKSLFNDILIQVTGFFRDPPVFQWLKKHYLSQLVHAKGSREPIRIWVPACSTGEEVYSLAILLMELMDGKKDCRPVQIFGTDINDTVLEKARAGFFAGTIKRQLSPERLRRFFEPVDGGLRICKRIRDLCIFARQNLAVDPPFSNLDLVSCRNVLIYLSADLQRKILPVFHFALRPNGLLLLGTSESAGSASNLFTVRDKNLKVYAKKSTAMQTVPQAHVHALRRGLGVQGLSLPRFKKLGQSRLRAAVDKIIRQNTGARPEEARVVPLPIPQTEDKIYLVFADPKGHDTETSRLPPGKPDGKKAGNMENERLQRELSLVRESLRATIEQAEAANEELRAANEEIVSSNEELQSANEELEAAKEELQSSNHELVTLNEELENRNLELERAYAVSSQFKAIVDFSDDAIISKDLNGIIRTWNNGAQKIFGYAPGEIVGKSVTLLIPPENHDEEPAILARIRAGERIDHYETIRVRKDGRRLNISLTVSPIKNSTGQIVGASKIARDITEKKRWESELQKAHADAEKASQAKDEFLATLSHELRTPLNPVLLVASDAAADPDLPPGVRANFDIIRRNVELEARLIDDLLDLTRVKNGKLKIEKRDVDLRAVLLDTISMVQSEIELKKITLTQKIGTHPSIVSGDTTRLQQIIWNVLKNAIKFTPPEGAIRIESHAREGCCLIKVCDNGIGMTSEELSSVFAAFKQGEHAQNSSRFGGLGLGLAISKTLVELHSGTIEASSDGRDRGATFTIKFPLAHWGKQAAN